VWPQHSSRCRETEKKIAAGLPEEYIKSEAQELYKNIRITVKKKKKNLSSGQVSASRKYKLAKIKHENHQFNKHVQYKGKRNGNKENRPKLDRHKKLQLREDMGRHHWKWKGIKYTHSL